MTIIKAALGAFVNSAPPAFDPADRSSTVGASEIGQCIRKVFWFKNEGDKRLGVARDAEYSDNWGARKRGSTIEAALWVPALRKKFGKRLMFAGKLQRTFSHKHLSATPDGLVTRLNLAEKTAIENAMGRGFGGSVGDCVTVECKTADPRTNLVEAKDENIYQTHVQMGILRAKTQYKPTHAILSYIDASFWNEVKEFVIPFDPKTYTAAQERAERIMTSTSLENIPPEGWIAGGKECRYCPFTKACGIERRNLPFEENGGPIDKQFVAEITDMARVIKSAERERDAWDAVMRKNQDELKSRLREKNLRKVPGVVTWSSVKGRESWDNKGLRIAAADAGVDVFKFSTVGEPTDRLVIQLQDEQP